MKINDKLISVLDKYSLPHAWIKKLEGECVVWSYYQATQYASDGRADMVVYRCYFNIFTKSNVASRTAELIELLRDEGFSGVEDRLTDYEETGWYNSNLSALIELKA